MTSASAGPLFVNCAHIFFIEVSACAFKGKIPPVVPDEDFCNVVIQVPQEFIDFCFRFRLGDHHGNVPAAECIAGYADIALFRFLGQALLLHLLRYPIPINIKNL